MTRLLSFMLLCVVTTTNAQGPCASPKVHEFDFWIGSWIVYKNGTDTVAGYSEIKPVAGGCSLLESYTNAKGNYTGNSLNKFNSVNGKWQQFWVDNGGTTLFIEGSYSNNKLTMENQDNNADGTTTNNRITWFKNQDGTVRQLWEQSSDKGKTWNVAFDGLYKKKT